MQTFTPIEYLKIDIASNYGLDKETWNARLDWFHENQYDIETIGLTNSSKVKRLKLMKEADSPALFYAGIKAWMQAKAGKAIGYPVSLDATASGAQILAAMVGCEKSAQLCNVVDTGNREDLYTNIYQRMCERYGSTGEFDRTAAKQAVMTWLYGSTAEPKKAFGEGDLLETFYQTMFEDAPGISKANVGILNLWDPTVNQYNWTLPDGFEVNAKVMGKVKHSAMFLDQEYEVIQKVQMPQERGLSLGANVVHSVDGMIVREMVRRCDFDPEQNINVIEMIMQSDYARGNEIMRHRKRDQMVLKLQAAYEKSGFMSARIIDYLDYYNMALVDYSAVLKILRSMPTKPFHVLTIHDCFRVHPNYANDLRRQYNLILSDIANSTLLEFILNQVTGQHIAVPKMGNLSDQILQANYALS